MSFGPKRSFHGDSYDDNEYENSQHNTDMSQENVFAGLLGTRDSALKDHERHAINDQDSVQWDSKGVDGDNSG